MQQDQPQNGSTRKPREVTKKRPATVDAGSDSDDDDEDEEATAISRVKARNSAVSNSSKAGQLYCHQGAFLHSLTARAETASATSRDERVVGLGALSGWLESRGTRLQGADALRYILQITLDTTPPRRFFSAARGASPSRLNRERRTKPASSCTAKSASRSTTRKTLGGSSPRESRTSGSARAAATCVSSPLRRGSRRVRDARWGKELT